MTIDASDQQDDRVRIAAIQHDIAWEDPERNFESLRPRVLAAAEKGADLILLAELFSYGFSMETERIAEPVGGPSTVFLQELATETGSWIAGSLPERVASADLPHNALLLAGPDGTLHRYRKIHPFSLAKEHEHYLAGSEFLTVTVKGLRCTFFICYDLRFADAFWGLANDTDLFVVVANWPQQRRDHWRTLLRGRAIENQAFVVGVNRRGEGGGQIYSGDSVILGPLGETLAEAQAEETTLFAHLDAHHVRDTRERLPFLKDRRPEPP